MIAGERRAVALLSLSVLAVTSTWLSGTAVLPSLSAAWGLSPAQGAWMTSATQLGFITGTVLYAATNLADVFSPRLVYVVSAVLAAVTNLALALVADSFAPGVALRFGTGVFLAGVYPVAMKLVASWTEGGLGPRLGVMVGALVFGTASPWLIRSVGTGLEWQSTVIAASALAGAGAVCVLVFVAEGPHLRERAPFDARMMASVFRQRSFRRVAFGYFGHMWELYAFWSLLALYMSGPLAGSTSVEPLVFAVISAGGVGCMVGGWLSRHHGERTVALWALVASSLCCLVSPLAVALPVALFVPFVLFWGLAVSSDSPQLSAMSARACPREYIGTALTVQNGIGFAITIVSIQLMTELGTRVGPRWVYLPLAIGPALGALSLRGLGRTAEG